MEKSEGLFLIQQVGAIYNRAVVRTGDFAELTVSHEYLTGFLPVMVRDVLSDELVYLAVWQNGSLHQAITMESADYFRILGPHLYLEEGISSHIQFNALYLNHDRPVLHSSRVRLPSGHKRGIFGQKAGGLYRLLYVAGSEVSRVEMTMGNPALHCYFESVFRANLTLQIETLEEDIRVTSVEL